MVTSYMPLVKFILSLQLMLSRPQRNHMISLMHGILLCEGRKTITSIRKQTGQYRDLSCITRFLKESTWCKNRVQRRRIQFLIERIRRSRRNKGDSRTLVFFIIDDTSCKKDKSTKRMEGLDFHFAHDDGKSQWSHCLVTSHLVTDGFSLSWDFRPYFRKEYCEKHNLPFKSKNDLAIQMIEDYPASDDELVYVLMDSWYTSEKIVNACNAKGFHIIAALKSNRLIAPAGIRISLADFTSQYVRKSDLRSVTTENRETYWIYQYEGPVADIENVNVLMSWENTYESGKNPFFILCTDKSLDVVTILRYYDVRWHIETGYRYFKDLMGFDHYQLWSFQAIERFWVIQFLTQNFVELQRYEWSKTNAQLTFGDVVRRIRQDYFGQLVVYVYEQALAKTPLFDVLKRLKLTA
ncbi:IS701 family transposase [Paenibacillus sp. BR2-3]|uniref:IS701 family transposase n=1 Tax=Paenibacillus sp. BR2-3 TaxID=3048494 RepID=UPI0039779366